jgi:enolase
VVSSKRLEGNIKKLSVGLDNHAIEGVGSRLNDNSTISESLQFLMSAKHANIGRICHIGSNETEDTALVDVAFASRCEFIDIGGPLGSEHSTKYNRLLNIARRENI